MSPAPVISITGHRGVPSVAPVRVAEQLRELVGSHPGATWLTGGAIGVEQIAAQVLLDLGARLELILPFPPRIQGARWTPAQRESLRVLTARAAAVEVLRESYHVSGYHQRNRRLLERADVLVAFWDGRKTGGTASVVLEAERRGIPVVRGWV